MTDEQVIAKVREAAKAVSTCAAAHEPATRLVGNVRADDVAAVARIATSMVGELKHQIDRVSECEAVMRDGNLDPDAWQEVREARDRHREFRDSIMAAMREAVQP